MPLFIAYGFSLMPSERWVCVCFARKHLNACEKVKSGGFAICTSAAIMRAAREGAGVAERDGFEIR